MLDVSRQKLGLWSFFEVWSLVFFDIALDCSLGQCLISETSKKKQKKQPNKQTNLGQNDILYSNVVERLLKLACFVMKV